MNECNGQAETMTQIKQKKTTFFAQVCSHLSAAWLCASVQETHYLSELPNQPEIQVCASCRTKRQDIKKIRMKMVETKRMRSKGTESQRTAREMVHTHADRTSAWHAQHKRAS